MTCPRCTCPDCRAAHADPIDGKVIELREACGRSSIVVTGDGCIAEADAARLLNLSPKTLANRRATGDALLVARKVGRQVQISLRDIAGYLIGTEIA
jgi:hypothetical protein